MEELERQVGWAETFGLPLQRISADEAQELFPLMSTERVLGATYLPTDGYLDPSQLAYALATGARAAGCHDPHAHPGARHRRRLRRRRRRGVRTDRGDVECEVVVDAAGMFAAEIARMVGVRVPIVPMCHQYVVTSRSATRRAGRPRLPTLRDPDLLVYYREDVAGLVMGGYERQSRPFAARRRTGSTRVPADFNGRLLPEEWERLEEIYANSVVRVPAMADVEIRKVINGPEGFTPDNEFCLGPDRGRAGSSWPPASARTASPAPAASGKVMADWLLDGDPGMDLWEMDVRRFGAQYRSPSYTLARVVENYETYYDIKYPGHERHAGPPAADVAGVPLARGARAPRSARRAAGSGSTTTGPTPPLGDESMRPRGWAGRAVVAGDRGRAPRAPARRAGLFDESSFAKIEVSGPGAAALLEWVCDNRVARGAGRVTYTQLLNARGGIECDFTVTPARRRDASWSSPARRSAATTWPGCAGTRPRDGSVRAARRHRRRGRASACGGREARDVLAAADAAVAGQRGRSRS